MKLQKVISLVSVIVICLTFVFSTSAFASSYTGPDYYHDANYGLTYWYHLSASANSSTIAANAVGWANDFVSLDSVKVTVTLYKEMQVQLKSNSQTNYDDYLASTYVSCGWPSGSQTCYAKAYFYFTDSYYGNFTGLDYCALWPN